MSQKSFETTGAMRIFVTLSQMTSCWYTEHMDYENPKRVRRELLTILYESFLENPLQMLSPSDIREKRTIEVRDLVSSAHYLHERNYIEMMVGYTPPLFAATRIAPLGIDLFENVVAFNQMFPLSPQKHSEQAAAIIPLMLSLAKEAEATSLAGERRDWMLADIRKLREALSQPEENWSSVEILTQLQWLDGFFMPEENAPLPSLERLKTILHERLM